MRGKIPMVGFAAYSGVGKTTLIEGLVAHFAAQGIRTAVIKHDGHGFQMDRPGTDSHRFTQAGAAVTVLTSAGQTAVIEDRGRSLAEAAALIEGVDLILVEGWKQGDHPQIGLRRGETGFPGPPERYIALVSDRQEQADIPCFRFDQTEAIAAFILAYCRTWGR